MKNCPAKYKIPGSMILARSRLGRSLTTSLGRGPEIDRLRVFANCKYALRPLVRPCLRLCSMGTQAPQVEQILLSNFYTLLTPRTAMAKNLSKQTGVSPPRDFWLLAVQTKKAISITASICVPLLHTKLRPLPVLNNATREAEASRASALLGPPQAKCCPP